MTESTSRFAPAWLPWVLLALLAGTGIRTISNPDYFVHLIGSTVPLSGADPVSYGFSAEVATNSSWLYDRMLGSVHGLLGAPGATVLHILAVAAAFGILIPVVRKEAGVGAVCLALALSAWMLLPRFEPRAATFAILFPAVFLRVLLTVRAPAIRVGILLLTQLLWVNSHHSFIFGPLLVLGFLIGEIQEGKQEGKSEFPTQTAALLGACLVVSVLNPWNIGLLTGIPGELSARNLSNWEHVPNLLPLIQSLVIYPHLGMFGEAPPAMAVNTCLALGGVGLVLFRGKLPWGITMAAIASGVLVVIYYTSLRENFALCAFPFLALALNSIDSFLRSKASETPAIECLLPGLALLSGLALFGSVANNSYFVTYGSGSGFGLGTSKSSFSEPLVKMLQEEGAPQKLLTAPIDSAYLAGSLEHGRVALDPRYRTHEITDYKTVTAAIVQPTSDEGQASLEALAPDAVVINLLTQLREFALPSYLSLGWRVVYFDGLYVVLVPDTKPYEGSVAAWMQSGIDLLKTESAQVRSKAGAPFYQPIPFHCIGAGAALVSPFQNFQLADAFLDIAEDAVVSVPNLSLNRGLTKLALKDGDLAARYLQEARRDSPGNIAVLEYLAEALKLANRESEAQTLLIEIRELQKQAKAKTES